MSLWRYWPPVQEEEEVVASPLRSLLLAGVGLVIGILVFLVA